MKNSNQRIEAILSYYKNDLGNDYDMYRNHVFRVFSICILIDNRKENEDKYAIAAAFHDLGIWTQKTFDYLRPSIVLAHAYLNQIGKVAWSEEIELMIDMHHKRSRYRGIHHKTVETFRRADWMDVTKGRRTFGFEKGSLDSIVELYPYLGFHRFLLVQTMKNFFKSPFNPLPMFKR